MVPGEEVTPEVNVKTTRYVCVYSEQNIGEKNHNRKIAKKSSGNVVTVRIFGSGINK